MSLKITYTYACDVCKTEMLADSAEISWDGTRDSFRLPNRPFHQYVSSGARWDLCHACAGRVQDGFDEAVDAAKARAVEAIR